MSLESTISEVKKRLARGFPNEQAVSQGVVLPILQELGWDTGETTTVWPEYSTGEGRADFALCCPASQPAIFIEVKQPGKAEVAERQIFSYAVHSGAALIVLTDGRTWSFYAPVVPGNYEDRRVYKLDLFERQPAEAAEVLTRYLSRLRVENGDAFATAQDECRNRYRQTQARAEIPRVWCELVQKGDEDLVNLLAIAVESKVGVRPDTDDIAEYLAGLANLTPEVQRFKPQREPSISVSSATESQNRQSDDSSRSGTLTMFGNSYQYQTAKEAMVIILRELADRDPSFLERCAQHPDAHGRTRQYIARSPDALYPDPRLRAFNNPLPGGWFVATNLNNVEKRSIIRLATEVAGVSLGTDVVVEL